MQKEFKFSIQDEKNTLNFIALRLEPFEQFDLILKVIGIVAKGSLSNSAQVQQVLHNVFQTGKEVEDTSKIDVNSFALILDAIKGALASLSGEDRDWLLSELLKNVKLDCGQSYIVQATREELNKRLSGFRPIIQLLTKLVKINLGFL